MPTALNLIDRGDSQPYDEYIRRNMNLLSNAIVKTFERWGIYHDFRGMFQKKKGNSYMLNS